MNEMNLNKLTKEELIARLEAAEAADIKGYLFKGGSLLEFVKNIVEG